MPKISLSICVALLIMSPSFQSQACEDAPCPNASPSMQTETENCEGSDCPSAEDPPPAPETPPSHTDLLLSEDFDFPLDMSIYMLGGWQRPDLNAINQKLNDQGFQAFAQDQFSVGGGLQLSFANLLTEFQGWVNISLPALNSDYITWQYAGAGLFNLGYIFHPTRDLRIYPVLGVGMGTLDLHFTQRNQIQDFDSFLKNPGRQGQISAIALVLNAGLGLDYRLRVFDDWGFRVGLRGGWLWTPVPGNFWQATDLFRNDQSNNTIAVPGGPNVGLTGPYLHMTLGF
ncbi:hypothetical protein COW36_05900 [bacterium (Candidatus Blackallbacteria) CG17_big_fil_post_rev_8_21_14_2_50_48_46]|uniref:Outer membrane protein beta-barrel domain-containing protein n=1 Tax=bacterium (Candidatus Blackallbacteria) CG17_big_fil_post_rev_8_21_14_2_50_48_46 TaxID=2014261 RepID=A0A2M7G888_9BACT|nr:MAG: hypothetical protein COW64_21495 [bacterium (Candidatus Blackallbacteria) CG18_big_fil_WC_8_21_14_2_50_49_26]PIW18299.1 MAG: hypothetical protein COW36_05900 [bacterium (Candidatus Blackallbacteria) CG17_big_fil_post_rev_8_21_14_2_50_48_46]PIW49523.1 MAG: hypothetical protein COW20_05715 [bacterium (Candidatus Blackallbacteria) CG13_big_fil_rev_8_21_14_2_50_49_14]